MWPIYCLLICLVGGEALANQSRLVCDLSDRTVIGSFYSNDSDCTVVDGETAGTLALGVTFQTINDWPSVRYDLPILQDWSAASLLVVRLFCDSDTSQNIEIGIEDASGKAYKPARRVESGHWTDIRLPVRQMALGSDEGAWCGEAIDISRINRFWFLAYSPVKPLKVRFARIALVTSDPLPAPMLKACGAGDGVALTWSTIPGARVYDLYRREIGQFERRLCRFPIECFVDTSAEAGKRYTYRVVALDEFLNPGIRSRPVRGSVDPSARRALPELNQYGGRRDVKLRVTGFFQVEQLNSGRWVLVDPEGHPLLSIGLCVISLGDSYTRVTRRENLFSEFLPTKDDPRFRDAWTPPYGYGAYGLEEGTGLVFSPYVHGLIARHGEQWQSRWQERTIHRLDDWHINTSAAWSAANLKRPYVTFAGGWGDTPTIPTATGHLGVPDVFDPVFVRNVEQSTQGAAALKDDPWLIGYFTANEMGWYGDWEHGMNLVACIHAAPRDLAAKQAWVEFLRGRYADIAALNTAWGTAFAGLEALLDNTEKPPNNAAARADASAFLEQFADRYFGTIAKAIRQQDPNHLILGARHSQGAPAEVIRAESRYNDVVSATIYGLRPNRPVHNGSRDTDKPWIAGEFHFQAEDAGLPFRQVEGIFPTQAQRGDAYQDYIADGFGLSNFIGAHWFEYIDEPATGRFDGGKDGGECHNIGWVNVRDEVYSDFVERARLINANLPLIIR